MASFFQIAQVHNLKQQENLMLAKDAQIKKFVLLLPKDPTQVTFPAYYDSVKIFF